jgi:hypothetical protein
MWPPGAAKGIIEAEALELGRSDPMRDAGGAEHVGKPLEARVLCPPHRG